MNEYYKLVSRICVDRNIVLHLDDIDCERNFAAYAGKKHIFMGTFDDPDIFITAFFHELGHCVNARLRRTNCHLCKLSNEGAAWEMGFHLAKKYGFDWDYDSKERKWARKQLQTYIHETIF